MSLYQSAVRKPITTGLIYLAVAILGVFSLSKLSVDLLPSMGDNTILVMTTYAGASAADIENNVTKVLESTLSSVSDLKHISSQSKENFSLVVLEFEYGIDIDVATNDVRDKLGMVSNALPDDANTPILFKFGTEDIPVMLLSVQAEQSMNALYKILDDRVASPLSRIKGVGTVSISGAPERQIHVYCDPYRLEAYNLTIEAVASCIGYENRNTPAGNIDLGSETYSMRIQGEFSDASQLENIVVGSMGGQNIYLRDVARIEDSIIERAQSVLVDNVQGGMLVVQKQSGANTVQICNTIMEKLPEIQKNLPSDVKIDVIMDSSDNINRTVDSLVEAILVTLILVVIVVLFFLGRWRATLIVAIVIPISLVGAFIYLLLSGNTLNIISLSSLSIAIGLVVDDAIVVLENISTHIERGTKPKSAAIYATSEVSVSIIAATLTILAVFLPLTMVSGMSGELFRQLGWIVSVIIGISLIAALSLTPMLSSVLLKQNPKRSKGFGAVYGKIEQFLAWLDKIYSHLLSWVLRHRKLTIFTALAIFVASLFLLTTVPTEFFPQQDNARLSITVKLPIGTRAEISEELAERIYKQFREDYPEIEMVTYSVGQASEDNLMGQLSDNGTHVITWNVRFCVKTERKRGIAELSDAMRKDLSTYPEIRTFNVSSGMGGLGGAVSVDIELYAYDFAESDRVATEVMERMRNVKGVSQVNISRDEYIPELKIYFDREKLVQNGLNLTTSSMFVRNRFNGSLASYFREDGEEYDIRVRYAPEFRNDLESINNILLYNSQGKGIRLRDVAQVVEELTPPTINRKDRERITTISAVADKDAKLSELVALTEVQIAEMTIPEDMMVNIGGTYEDQQDSFKDLFTLMILIVILVYIVMAAQFESFTYPFVIMFSIPFAFTGVALGLSLTNTALGIMALIGVIMLIGIVVKNGIVLIDYTILCRERGQNVHDAVVTAGRSRLRPILMTTLTTVIGMIPLAIGNGVGAEMWNSLGLTVAWGLSVSTLVTLVLIPTIYSIFADFGLRRKARKAAAAKALPQK